MNIASLSLILAVLAGWWLFTVALATGAFKLRSKHLHRHDKEAAHRY